MVWYILFHTTLGLKVTAQLVEPARCHVRLGISVIKGALPYPDLSGAFCGLAGAFLSICMLGSIPGRDITAGRVSLPIRAIVFACGCDWSRAGHTCCSAQRTRCNCVISDECEHPLPVPDHAPVCRHNESR